MTVHQIRANFIDLVRRYLAHDEYLTRIFDEYCDIIPESFWTAPASVTGKYHPSFSLGEHGLVRHTVAVLFVAVDIARLWELDTVYDVALVAFAAAAHDTMKGGPQDDWTNDDDPQHLRYKAHPVTASTKLLSLISVNDDIADIMKLTRIAIAVERHESLWGSVRRPLNVPTGSITSVVPPIVIADYTTSRRYFAPDDLLAEILSDFGWEGEPDA